jgi:disulfide bond formation protein DsbB
MSSKRIVLAVAALSLIAGVAHAGGRAHVSILSTPKQVVAGRAFDVAFAVSPDWPMSRDRAIEPTVKAVCGDQVITVSAVPLKAKGQFKAAVTLPSAGNWSITVDSRYCQTVMKALVLKAEAGAQTQS